MEISTAGAHEVDRTGIYSVESEEALLGSVIINPEVLADIPWLKPGDFFIVRHGWLYETILTLRNRGEAIDILTITDELRERKQLEDVGGSAYIVYLSNQTPTWTHYHTFARMVESTARRRRLLAAASGIAQGAIDGTNKDQVKELLALAQSFLETPDGPPNELRQYLLHVSDLGNLPEVTWLIPGELPERGLAMYFGPSGVGKSFVALDRALTLSEHIPVVYIAAEGEYGFKVRVAAWCEHHQKSPADLKLYFFMNVISLITDQEREDFTRLIEPIRPRLVIVDTVAHCMLPGNENDTREMGLFVRGAKSLQKKFDCATLLVHHTNKGGKVERGNVSLRNACDVIARISDDDGVIAFECSKTKDAAPFETHYYRLLPIQLSESSESRALIEAKKVIQTEADPLTRNQQKILDTLKETAYAEGLSRGELVEITDIPIGSVGRVLSKLIQFHHVTQANKGGKYRLFGSPPNPDTDVSYGHKRSIQGKNGHGEPAQGPTVSTVSVDSHDSEDDDLTTPVTHRNIDTDDTGQMKLWLERKAEKPSRPQGPCPKCGTDNWRFFKLTQSWHCDTCRGDTLPEVDNKD